MTAAPEGKIPLRISIGIQGDSLVQRVVAAPEGTEPSAYIVIAVNPDGVNSYDEFMSLMNIFDTEFVEEISRVMGIAVMNHATEHPDLIPLVREAVVETMEMQGFTREAAEAITDESSAL